MIPGPNRNLTPVSPKIALPSGVQEGFDPFNDPNDVVQAVPTIMGPAPVAPIPQANPTLMAQPVPANQPQPMNVQATPQVATSPAIPLPTPENQDEVEPAVPLKVDRVLEELDYYHGLLPREDIEALLKKEGDYLLRQTEIREGNKNVRYICLSVYWVKKLHHFLLKPSANNKYCLPNAVNASFREHTTIMELVTYYIAKQKTFGIYSCQLLSPVRRQEWEIRHHELEFKVRLGAGAFGEVYSGEYRRKKKRRVKVAIKMLKIEKIDKKKILEIMHEARVMRTLKHRNIVRCYGIAADKEPLMIVMELINGGALDVWLRAQSQKHLPLVAKLGLALDAGYGLEYLHSKRILHRDIAARNCLYDSKAVKLSDFGLSVQGEFYKLDANERAPVRWLSPEVFKCGVYTKPADVWAYGVLVWEIFWNGEEPYKGMTGSQIRESVSNFGNKLVLPDWVPVPIHQVHNEYFNTDANLRLTMAEIVRKFEKLIPKRTSVMQSPDEDDSTDDSKKKKMKNNGQTSKQGVTKLLPKESESLKERYSGERTKMTKIPKKSGSREPLAKDSGKRTKSQQKVRSKSREAEDDDSKRAAAAGKKKKKKASKEKLSREPVDRKNSKEKRPSKEDGLPKKKKKDKMTTEKVSRMMKPVASDKSNSISGENVKRGGSLEAVTRKKPLKKY